MRKFGPNKAALHFRRAKKKAEEVEEDEEPQRYRLEEGDGTSHAQRIVRELYFRYEKQLQRWKDYRNLFVFLGFVALFLAILYEQRQSAVSYDVYSTVDSVVTPKQTTMQDNTDVYNWLNGLLTEVWRDPICGDGLCEAPFEFASYSRFGCRADCGKLTDVQNLTAIQIDIYWDFSHPVGSIPASDLMQQASWNLCPQESNYSPDCYFETDNTFDRLASQQQYLIDDAPDGNWDLIVRQDIFKKIRGAVRDTTLVSAAAYYYKLYVAAESVAAERNFEKYLLMTAKSYVEMGFFKYVDTVINASYPNATEFAFNRTQAFQGINICANKNNGTFGSSGVADSDWYTGLFYPIPNPNNTLVTDATNFLGNVSSGPNLFALAKGQGYVTMYDPTFTAVDPMGADYTDPSFNLTYAPYVWVYNFDANNTYLDRTTQRLTNATYFDSVWCKDANLLLYNWATNYTRTIRSLLLDQRLGDARTTGKIVQRNTATTKMRNYLIVNMPELVSPIFDNPKGTVPLEDPMRATVSTLQALYLDSPKYQLQAQRAAINMTRRFVYATNYTLVDLYARASARLVEIDDQRASTRAITIPWPMPAYQNVTFANRTLGDIVGKFRNAGGTSGVDPSLPAATPAFLPLPSNASLEGLALSYNLVSWNGNTTAYMRCGLADRGPEYIGTCVAMTTSCVATTNDTVPYNCTDYGTGLTVNGSLANTTYRLGCEIPCDRRADCNTVCDCFGTCGAREYCECSACTQSCAIDTSGAITCTPVNENAAYDSQFVDVRTAVMDSASASLVIADVGASAGGRRRLQDTDSQLADILSTLSGVTSQQSAISTQMTTLRSQVDLANQLAQARANDNRLIDLISAGRADIQAGQSRIEAKLDTIIGKQNQALEAANKALTALSNIQSLADKQLAAQKALETAVNQQLSAIRVATVSKVITLTQALALWKRARRDRMLTYKAAKLANIPCNSAPYADNYFTLDNGNIVDNSTSRERNVGLTNRVIGGLLLQQTRTNETLCPESKFDKIQKTCTGPSTVASYGIDPVFKRGTTLYDPDFDDPAGMEVVSFYNCSQLSKSTYNVTFLNQTVNQVPYCAELYNPQGLPYAFHFLPLDHKPDGFPVYFDINLSQDEAQQWYTYLQEGLYLDQNTRKVTAELVTYNAQLRIFAYERVKFTYGDGGSIKVKTRLNTVRLELYQTEKEKVQLAFTVILALWIYLMMAYNLWQIAYTQKTKGFFLKYFLRGWNWVEFISNALLTTTSIMWWVYVRDYANKFDMSIRYNVYMSMHPDANYLALAGQGQGLEQANAAINELRELNDYLNWYFALNGINILLLIARVLKLMDFQPRLGVVTRSLWLAGPDLVHFAIVAGMVFIGYAMMAHLIFGNAIQEFASFGESINTCFEILLGNIDVNQELRDLGGLQSVAGALFFWSYELLVFMVLLNFLLAIIVDAFSEVKEKTHETVGIHTELFMLLRDKWRGLLGRCSPNYISDAKLGLLLRQWAGEDEREAAEAEAAAAAAAADAEKLLTVLNEDLDEETLKNVLMECMRDAPGDAAEKDRRVGLLAKVFGRKSRLEATPEEISLAAHYIIDRFGAVPTYALDDADADAAGEAPLPDQQVAIAGGAAGMAMGGGGAGMGNGGGGGMREAALEKERDQLAQALERLAEVQRELAEGQRNLMAGQKQLAEQQSKLVQLMNDQGPSA